MTAEQLHDALGLLPSDLIAEADKRRNQGTKSVIHWYRWISLAACVVLILGCGLIFSRKVLPGMGGGSMESAMQFEAAADCAPEEPAAMMPETNEECSLTDNAPADAHTRMEEGMLCDYFLTPGDPDSIPAITVIRSREELEAYWETYGERWDFESMRTGCEPYGEDWFETRDMLLLPVLGKSADTTWEITGFSRLDENGWEWAICYAFHTIVEEDGLVGFHLLTSVQKGMILPEDDILTVVDTLNSTVNGESFNE